ARSRRRHPRGRRRPHRRMWTTRSAGVRPRILVRGTAMTDSRADGQPGTAPSEPSVNPWVGGFRIAKYRPKWYVGGGLLWVMYHSLPVLTGIVLKAVFDRVSEGGSAPHGA